MPNSTRGFASMSKARRQAVAGNGGKKAHLMGRAHTWTKEEASLAGRKGGRKRKEKGMITP